MMNKQLFLDVIIVLFIPLVVVGAYFLWFRDESGPLLSASSEMLQTKPDEPGALTKASLHKLNSITLDDSIFRDPAFLSLRKYSVEIPTAELSREYPFTPSPEVAEMLKRAKSNVNSKSSVSGAKPESIAAKLDLLKSSTSR